MNIAFQVWHGLHHDVEICVWIFGTRSPFVEWKHQSQRMPNITSATRTHWHQSLKITLPIPWYQNLIKLLCMVGDVELGCGCFSSVLWLALLRRLRPWKGMIEGANARPRGAKKGSGSLALLESGMATLRTGHTLLRLPHLTRRRHPWRRYSLPRDFQHRRRVGAPRRETRLRSSPPPLYTTSGRGELGRSLNCTPCWSAALRLASRNFIADCEWHIGVHQETQDPVHAPCSCSADKWPTDWVSAGFPKQAVLAMGKCTPCSWELIQREPDALSCTH